MGPPVAVPMSAVAVAAALAESHDGAAEAEGVAVAEGGGESLRAEDGEAPLDATELLEGGAEREGGSLPVLSSEPMGFAVAPSDCVAASVAAADCEALLDATGECEAAGERESTAPVAEGRRTDSVGTTVGGNSLAVGLGEAVAQWAVAVGATVSLELNAALEEASGVSECGNGEAVGAPTLALCATETEPLLSIEELCCGEGDAESSGERLACAEGEPAVVWVAC